MYNGRDCKEQIIFLKIKHGIGIIIKIFSTYCILRRPFDISKQIGTKKNFFDNVNEDGSLWPRQERLAALKKPFKINGNLIILKRQVEARR